MIGSQGGYKTWAEIRDDAGPGTFFMSIDAQSFDWFSDLFPTICATPNPGLTCETRTGPNREKIIIGQGKQDGDVTVYTVSVVKPDGTSLWANLWNYSQNDQPPSKSGVPIPQRATPPMTAEEIVDLLLTPGLTLYP